MFVATEYAFFALARVLHVLYVQILVLERSEDHDKPACGSAMLLEHA